MNNITNPDIIFSAPYSSDRSLGDIRRDEAIRMLEKLDRDGFMFVAQIGSVSLEGTTVADAVQDGNYELPRGIDKVVVGPVVSGDGETVDPTSVALYAKTPPRSSTPNRSAGLISQ